MRKIFLMIICLTVLSIGGTALAVDYNGSKFGVGLLYSSEGIFTLRMDGAPGFSVGIFGKNWQSAEVREAGTSNYGQTQIDDDETEYIGIDLGWSWAVAEHLRLGIEGSVASKTEYSKWSDRRFTENYYLSEEDSEVLFGAGAIAAVPITKNFEIIASGHTIKGIGGGVMIRF